MHIALERRKKNTQEKYLYGEISELQLLLNTNEISESATKLAERPRDQESEQMEKKFFFSHMSGAERNDVCLYCEFPIRASEYILSKRQNRF